MEIEVKRLIQDKVIKVENNVVIVDIDEIILNELGFYEKILEQPVQFIDLVKEEVKVFGLNDPHIKFLNWKDEIDISKIRVAYLGNPVKLDGMVSKLTDSMALVISKSFSCSCGTTLVTQGKEPIRCSCGRRGGFKEESVKLQDIRELVLEELQEKTKGKQPQKIRVRLVGKLTDESNSDIIRPGNRISIIGIIDKIKINSKLEEEIFQYRVFTLGVSSLEEQFDDDLKADDMEEIVQIAADKPLDKLSKSLAPNIWGRDELKKILVLQMVNGVKKELSDGKFTRNWISILVVGSPSTSKSELATHVLLRTPKSFYASGDGASGVGITVSAVKDEILGNWAAEVGPIVKASGSTAILDELDKFPKDQLKALHTPMELGFVKFNKAGMDCLFPAETSVLAMANPKYGIFDDDKPLVEQINLPPALLSRFDIIYTLKDEIDKEVDDQIVEIIYSQSKQENLEIIPVRIFRKYINHARRIEPKLQKENLKDLQEFYHDIRKKSKSRDSNMKGMPIGVRHLQGIIRLAEASLVYDEPIWIKRKDYFERIKIGDFCKEFVNINNESDYKNILDKNIKCITIDNKGITKEINVKGVFKHPKKEIIKIKTNSGRETKITPDHSLFTLDNNLNIVPIRTDKLKVGDYIILPKKINLTNEIKDLDIVNLLRKKSNSRWCLVGEKSELKKLVSKNNKNIQNDRFLNQIRLKDIENWDYFNTNKNSFELKLSQYKTKKLNFKLNGDFGYLLGLLYAEGCFSDRIALSITDKDLFLKFRNSIENTFGIKLKSKVKAKSPSKKRHSNKPIYRMHLPTFVSEILYSLGIGIKTYSYNKKLPPIFLNGNEEFDCGLIKGYFDGDGNHNSSNDIYKFTSTSKELMQDIMFILSKRGIFTSIFHYKKRCENGHDYYDLIVKGGEYSNLFRKKILNTYKNKEISKQTTDVIPKSRSYLKNTFQDLKRIGINARKYFNNCPTDTLSRGRVKFSLPIYEKQIFEIQKRINKLKDLCYSDIILDKVKLIEYLPKEDTFDLEVPPYENFIGGFGNIQLHNSAKIRLSDVVETEDIDLAKQLFYDSLIKIGMDEGVIDLARISSGKTIGKRKYMEILLEIIKSIGSKEIAELDLKKVSEERNFPMNRFYEIIEELNKEGFIIKHGKFWILV